MSTTTFRILDANLNRAREALRVMEDHARFVLNDGGLSGALKGLRHDLAGAVPVGWERVLAAARETGGDVGRELGTSSEYERATPADVALAAGKRLSEALRTIEEFGKTVDAGFARAIERLRYRGYELEQRIALLPLAKERFGRVRLYVLITEALCRRPWMETVEAVIRGGADCLQLREKHLSDGELLRRASRFASVCRERGVLGIINDRPDLAALAGADGVHLGQDDMPVGAARRIVGPEGIVGLSTHNVEQVVAAAAGCPDYVAVGPMYPTPTKPQEHIAGPATLRAAREVTALPLVAIGGISPSNAEEVLAAAGCSLCVCTAIIGSEDAAEAAAGLVAKMAARESPAGRLRD